jgi:urea carboxylase
MDKSNPATTFLPIPQSSKFKKVLIANRGAIACRIIRTLKQLGIQSVAVYSEADQDALHVSLADEAVCIGPAPASESYLQAEKILEVAKQTGAQAIHPGYGFLSENAVFADACEAAGIAFIGPTGDQMRAFGLKHTARELALASNVPLLPGSQLLADLAEARREATRIGYPVMLKSTAGGGGIGMRLIWADSELDEAYASVHRLATANFKDAGMYLEKYVQSARHIEVQIFGDGHGKVLALGERDCSVQRRNQKVIEETPAPHLSDEQRQSLQDTAVRLMQSIGYRSAGTVEFVMDAETQDFYFLEVNTRLQVEHGVTEEVTGVDLVAWMVLLASGDLTLPEVAPPAHGASIQVRIYAEDPARNFQPSSGLLTEVIFPQSARVEAAVMRGSQVPPFYDPMVAKIIVYAADRAGAIANLQQALAETHLSGIETNLDYVSEIIAGTVFQNGLQTTRYLNDFAYQALRIEVLEAGVQTSVQDYPARLGYWDVGVPPSGPMDALALRTANLLLGNLEGTAGLECTMSGPTLKFYTDSRVCITGAPLPVFLDHVEMPMWTAFVVPAGSTLKLGRMITGCRSYIAVSGGINVPDYLGSKSTFTLGQFGGHAGRNLRLGDMLPITALRAQEMSSEKAPIHALPATLPEILQPRYNDHWEIGVLYGPHGAPDFFTPADIEMFFSTDWEIHYNSSRTGVRLIGPKPEWARRDGGEAGLHPSNIHDNAYAIGAIDFTGDMPVILGPDGPSLGGFVCPAVVVKTELWKLGQLRPGNTVRFIPISQAQTDVLEHQQAQALSRLDEPLQAQLTTEPETLKSAILSTYEGAHDAPDVVYRPAGDNYLLVEYGPLVLDLNLRFRIHALMQWLYVQKDAQNVHGIIDLTPGIRSLQVHYDAATLPQAELLALLKRAEGELPAIDDMVMPSRTVWLPLAWDDSQTRLAIEKYMQSVRPDAPWCPSNIEFIRRINGLDSIDDVKKIVFDASYLVMGLGDVYLGAPVATPLDPRHRLVTTKYNPARTWTPENAVGIGGAYMCVYGMEGPGGYQFVGRTIQMWNRYRETPEFVAGKPWLLRFFDQIRFYEVSEDELVEMRREFAAGRLRVKIEDGELSLRDYNTFLNDNATDITAFKETQQHAFEAERDRWKESGQNEYISEADAPIPESDDIQLPAGADTIVAHVPGNIWQVQVKSGDSVRAGDSLMIIESMKMEFPIVATRDGVIGQVLVHPGIQVGGGQNLLVLLEHA